MVSVRTSVKVGLGLEEHENCALKGKGLKIYTHDATGGHL